MRTDITEVVVTGLGATTPLGGDVKSTWTALLDGRSSTRALTQEWAGGLSVRVAAPAAVEPAHVLENSDAGRLERAGQFALVALREAWADAGFVGRAGDEGLPAPERVAVVLGSGIDGLAARLRCHGPLPGDTLTPSRRCWRSGSWINAQGAPHVPATGCAAGAESIAAALEMIRRGRVDVVVAGGAEAMIDPLTLTALAGATAMSHDTACPATVSRPYDTGRDGFVLGEGAAVLVLESARHARARGARVYCELAGAGAAADARSMAAPDPECRGLAAALRAALSDALLDPTDIAHVNAHAISTPRGDLAESLAVRSVLGTGGYAVSAIKAATGHLIGAAGALSALTSVLALSDRTAPPTINITEFDPAIELDVVRGEPRALRARPLAALSNTASFAGRDVVLAFRRDS